MLFQFEVSGPTAAPQAAPVPTSVSADVADILRHILETNKEQLALQRMVAISQDARWRAFLARWKEQYPGVSEACKTVLPTLERAYMQMIHELTELLQDQGADALDNDFSLGEFLDRFGVRLGQLGTIVSLVTPLAEAAGANQPQESGSEEAK